MENLLTVPLIVVALAVAIGMLALATGRNWRDPALPGIALRWGLGPVIAALWLLLFVAIVLSLFRLLAAPLPDNTGGDQGAYRFHYLALVGLMTALAGLVGFPLALLRVWTTERVTKATEEGLITERINKAVANLGTEKEKWEAGEKSTVPNMEVRLGGLFALERIAQDSDRDRNHAIAIICAYVRENAKLPIPPAITWDDALKRAKLESREEYTENEVAEYIIPAIHILWKLIGKYKPREDIQAALLILSKLNRFSSASGGGPEHADTVVDLKGAQLQGYNLSHMNFSHASFYKANLEGAFLNDSDFTHANFIYAQLAASHARNASFVSTDMSIAKFCGADLSGSHIDLSNATFTDFRGCSFDGAILEEKGSPYRGTFRAGAKLHNRTTSFGGTLFKGFRGQRAQIFPFYNADDDDRRFLTMDGIAIRDCDLRNDVLKGLPLENCFGDGSVTLPEHIQRPSHWPTETLNWTDFHTQWRACQAKIGYTPPKSKP